MAKQWVEGCQKAQRSRVGLQSRVIILCGFSTTSSHFHITQLYLIHCQYKILIMDSFKSLSAWNNPRSIPKKNTQAIPVHSLRGFILVLAYWDSFFAWAAALLAPTWLMSIALYPQYILWEPDAALQNGPYQNLKGSNGSAGEEPKWIGTGRIDRSIDLYGLWFTVLIAAPASLYGCWQHKAESYYNFIESHIKIKRAYTMWQGNKWK